MIDLTSELKTTTGTVTELFNKGVLKSTPFYVAVQCDNNIIVPHQSETDVNYYNFRLSSGKEILLHIGLDSTYGSFQDDDLWYSVDGWFGSNPFRHNRPNQIMYKSPMIFSGVDFTPKSLQDKFICYHPVSGETPSLFFTNPKLYLKLSVYRRCIHPEQSRGMVPGIKYVLGDMSLDHCDMFVLQGTTELNLEFVGNQSETDRLCDNNTFIYEKYLESGTKIKTLLDKITKANATIALLTPQLETVQDLHFALLQRKAVLAKLLRARQTDTEDSSTESTDTANSDESNGGN